MKVRHAELKDAGAIHETAASLKIEDQATHAHGFLIYVLKEERYKKRIEISPFFYVVEVDNCIKGFLMCYDDRTLQELAHEGEMTHEGNVPRFILSQPPPYVFIDQIGILKACSGSGLGRSMVETLFEEMKAHSISTAYVAIVLGPVENTASLSFFQKLNAEEISRIDNGDGYVSGIYRIL